MRPSHLKLAATGLFAMSAVLAFRIHMNGSVLPGSSLTPTRSVRLVPIDGPGTALPTATADTGAVQPAPAGTGPHAANSPDTTSNAPHKLPMGIRLADDVKLPAVILELSNPNRDPNHPIPAPVAAHMQHIVENFYQELADSARNEAAAANKPPGDGKDPAMAVAEAADTVVIRPGPAVEKATARADEMYRAAFGDEAYNRMTMNSLLEAQLPVNAPASGESNH